MLNLHSNPALNKWFTGILWVKIAFTSLGLISLIVSYIRQGNNNLPLECATVIITALAIVGAYQLTQANRLGFYLVVGTNLFAAIMSYVQYINLDPDDFGIFYDMASSRVLSGVWSGLAQIVILLLLMLIRQNGKNAYEVLWGKTEEPIEDPLDDKE